MTLKVSAITVNYNSGIALRELIESLTGELEIDRVIVVDNASVDGSADFLVTDAYNKYALLVRNSENRGFAAACNQGTELADSPYLLFINPDCRVETGALTRLVGALRISPAIGIVGPLIRNPDGSEQRGCRRYLPNPRRALLRVLGFEAPRSDGRARGFDLVGTPLPPMPTEVEAISGACMLVKRDMYQQVGGWDEGYFLHCEDLDLCMRFAQQGAKVLFVPDAVVHHVQGVSSRRRRVFVSWHKHRGMWRYFSKFQRPTSSSWLTALVWCGIWSRFLLLLPRDGLASIGGRRRYQSHAG